MSIRPGIVASLSAVAAAAAIAAGSAPGATSAKPTAFAAVKSYLLEHTTLLRGFTRDFEAVAERYRSAAERSGFSYPSLARDAAVRRDLARAKALWVKGNPYYERVEGVVAGTPSLAVYDVILDAGTSAAEDPASAVPFDLRLRNGKTLRKPGNLFNLTEGMLWGTLPAYVAARADLDGDGRRGFGEVLPDANVLVATAEAFDRYARELDRAARAWRPTRSDAFTSVVVMVPTMSEYFGQWKTSRFVLGDRASSKSFNVVSRLSDIGDILGGLRVIYSSIGPSIASVDRAQAAQTKRELNELHGFVERLSRQERQGRRFTPQQADVLGKDAQERATAIAGQVSQAAARLKVKIVQ